MDGSCASCQATHRLFVICAWCFRPGREPQNAVVSLLPPKVCLIFPVKTPAANCTGKILFSEMGFVYRPPLTAAQAQIGDLDALREYRKSAAKVANPGNCGLTGGRFWRFCKPAKSPYRQVGFYRPHRFERLRGNAAGSLRFVRRRRPAIATISARADAICPLYYLVRKTPGCRR